MNASTKALWLSTVIAAGFGGGVTGAIVAERPALAAPPAALTDPALANLVRYVRVDDGGNVTIAASNLNISASAVNIKTAAIDAARGRRSGQGRRGRRTDADLRRNYQRRRRRRRGGRGWRRQHLLSDALSFTAAFRSGRYTSVKINSVSD